MAVKTLNELTKASTIEDADKLLIGNENGTEYITINDLKDSIDVGGDDTTDIVVDDSISSSSENPVQNKVVHNALLNKANVVHTHSSEDITSLDASKLTGKIDIDRLPAGALERVVSVEDSTARFALTKDDIQLGDTVHELDTDLLYIVSDDDNLDNSGGYIEYTARYVTSVPWSGVTDKPDSYIPSAHTHTSSDITDLGTASVARASVAASAESVDWSDVDNKPSSYNPSTHNHTISQITDIANASVAFANSAGSVDWDDVNDKPSTFTPSTHSHDWDSITDKPSTFAPSTHNHTVSQISDIGDASVNYANSAGSADSVVWSNISNIPSTFAPSSHNHLISDISDFAKIKSGASDYYSFGNLSIGELQVMIMLADLGLVDLSNIWSIGDERNIPIPGNDNDACFCLMHKGFYRDKYSNYVNYVVGMKHCLHTPYPIHSDRSFSNWDNCELCTTCERYIFNAMSSENKSIFKPFVPFDSSDSCHFTIPSYSEMTIFDYYKTRSAIKLIGGGSAALPNSGDSWWLRVAVAGGGYVQVIYRDANGAEIWGSVTTYYYPEKDDPTIERGVSPFGCI